MKFKEGDISKLKWCVGEISRKVPELRKSRGFNIMLEAITKDPFNDKEFISGYLQFQQDKQNGKLISDSRIWTFIENEIKLIRGILGLKDEEHASNKFLTFLKENNLIRKRIKIENMSDNPGYSYKRWIRDEISELEGISITDDKNPEMLVIFCAGCTCNLFGGRSDALNDYFIDMEKANKISETKANKVLFILISNDWNEEDPKTLEFIKLLPKRFKAWFKKDFFLYTTKKSKPS